MPLVSIIMPCYNGAARLEQSVGSVRAQTLPDWELLLINDGSTDGSGTIIDEFARQDARIRPLHQANAGLVATRNRGIREARADLVGFLDADDTWHPEFLRAMTDALQARPDAGLAYCGWQNCGLGPKRGKPYVPPDYERGDKVESLLKSCPWPVHGALVRRRLLDDAGGFDPAFRACEDYDLWLRLVPNLPIARVPRVLAYYHHHHDGEQMTRNRARIAMSQLQAQQKFLRSNASVADRLGSRRIRELTVGEMLHRGYVAYWARDLAAARVLFREVMSRGYGGLKDWLYMLPAWLPERWHRRLLALRDRADADSVRSC